MQEAASVPTLALLIIQAQPEVDLLRVFIINIEETIQLLFGDIEFVGILEKVIQLLAEHNIDVRSIRNPAFQGMHPDFP